MRDFLYMVFDDWIPSIIDLLAIPQFEISGYNVSYFEVLVGFIFISIFVTVWWKGAKY